MAKNVILIGNFEHHGKRNWRFLLPCVQGRREACDDFERPANALSGQRLLHWSHHWHIVRKVYNRKFTLHTRVCLRWMPHVYDSKLTAVQGSNTVRDSAELIPRWRSSAAESRPVWSPLFFLKRQHATHNQKEWLWCSTCKVSVSVLRARRNFLFLFNSTQGRWVVLPPSTELTELIRCCHMIEMTHKHWLV